MSYNVNILCYDEHNLHLVWYPSRAGPIRKKQDKIRSSLKCNIFVNNSQHLIVLCMTMMNKIRSFSNNYTVVNVMKHLKSYHGDKLIEVS